MVQWHHERLPEGKPESLSHYLVAFEGVRYAEGKEYPVAGVEIAAYYWMLKKFFPIHDNGLYFEPEMVYAWTEIPARPPKLSGS
jgi:hypothetical protein